MKAIEIKGLTRDFGDKRAVDSLSLDIREGELFALLGVNGAGKTTTIRMLSCLLKPSAGDALVFGKSIKTQAEQVRRLINISPQETAVAPNLSVRENLMLIAGIYGLSRAQAGERAAKWMEELSLLPVAETKARKLSGGWQRRLSIAMALISEPKILFLDEPTLGLDVIARRELWKLISALRGRVTVILTTHYLEEAEALCDRAAIMSGGRLCELGTVEEIKHRAGTGEFEEAFIRLAAGEAAL